MTALAYAAILLINDVSTRNSTVTYTFRAKVTNPGTFPLFYRGMVIEGEFTYDLKARPNSAAVFNSSVSSFSCRIWGFTLHSPEQTWFVAGDGLAGFFGFTADGLACPEGWESERVAAYIHLCKPLFDKRRKVCSREVPRKLTLRDFRLRNLSLEFQGLSLYELVGEQRTCYRVSAVIETITERNRR
jgi:hypothetical protein